MAKTFRRSMAAALHKVNPEVLWSISDTKEKPGVTFGKITPVFTRRAGNKRKELEQHLYGCSASYADKRQE